MKTKFFHGDEAFFVVISAFRPHVVEQTHKITGHTPTWIVADGEYNAYKNAGAVEVIEGGGIVESRNLSLELASKAGLPLLTMDDELSRISEPVFDQVKGKYVSSAITFDEAVSRIIGGLIRVPAAHLAGIAPTDNPFYYSGAPVSRRKFIVASCMLIKPTDMRFDKQAELKEDYDFTIQNILRFGVVARRDDVLMTFAHKSKSGGVSSWRTTEIQNSVIKYLVLKWGSRYIRLNSKRPGEIILKF